MERQQAINFKKLYTDENYFSSKTSQYIFYLVEMDARNRSDKLKISPMLYSDREMADKWYNGILSILNLDTGSYNYDNAISKLNEFYNDMIAVGDNSEEY